MLIKTSTADFKQNIIEALQGVSKICINFCIKDNMLILQTTAGTVVERVICVKSIEKQLDKDITVIVDRTLELLNEKEEITEIEISEEMLIIRQKSFMFSATSQPELRVEINDSASQEFVRFDSNEFKSIASESRMLDDLTKLLGVDTAPINIVNGRAFVVYSNTVYVRNCKFPNVKIPSEMARKTASILTGNTSIQYRFNQESGNLELKVGDKKRVVMSTLNPDYRIVEAVAEKEQSLKFINKINISKYKAILDTVCRVYKKLLVDVSICNSDLRIFTNNISTQLDLGSKEIPDITVRISTAQLAAITKLFGELSEVEVLKGENMICLRHPYAKRILMIAGMLF